MLCFAQFLNTTQSRYPSDQQSDGVKVHQKIDWQTKAFGLATRRTIHYEHELLFTVFNWRKCSTTTSRWGMTNYFTTETLREINWSSNKIAQPHPRILDGCPSIYNKLEVAPCPALKIGPLALHKTSRLLWINVEKEPIWTLFHLKKTTALF